MKPAVQRLSWFGLFAVGMACVEAALVIYLRELYYPADPLNIFPLNLLSDRHLAIELLRETATVAMIIAVAFVGAGNRLQRWAAFLYIFGVWDIFYYVWLKLLLGWPRQWGEWDVLFLIPWPWLGPWLTPVVIALLFAVWGAWVLAGTRQWRWSRRAGALFVAGAVLGLWAFLAPFWPLLGQDAVAIAGYVPGGFPWYRYAAGVVLMAAGLWVARRVEPRDETALH